METQTDQTLKPRTRLFAVPVGGDQFYEFTAISISNETSFPDEPSIWVEVDAKDKKYVKRMRKGRVMLKFGILWSDGASKMTFNAFIAKQERDPSGLYVRFQILLCSGVEMVHD